MGVRENRYVAAMRLRPAVRALVVTPDHHVLLLRFGFSGGIWAPPGGGLEGEETHEEALRRELAEEIGLQDYTLGPRLYQNLRRFEHPHWDGQRDDVWLVRVPERFEPRPAFTREQLLAENVHAMEWVPFEATANLRVVPPALPQFLERLRSQGPPAEPLLFDDC